MSAAGLLAGLVSAVIFGLAAVGQARGVRGFEKDSASLATFVGQSVRDLGSWIVLLGYGAGFVLHAVAIQLLPLYLAQTTVAMALPVTAVASGWVEGRLSRRQWVAVIAVTAGLVLVAAGAGTAGEVVTTGTFALAIGLGVVALAVGAWWGRGRGAALLGTLAGLGYTGTAVAVRGVEAPITAVVVLAAVAVPVFGLLAFWVYSLGMRDARISAATAPMIVLQTLGPALLGIAFLGDRVRAGWWPAILVGLALATVAAITLSRDEQELSEVAA